MYEDRIPVEELRKKVMTAEQAAKYIFPGMTLCFSGFSTIGYPKMIPKAIAAKGTAVGLTVIAGASAGDELDGEFARCGLVRYRTPFNSNKDLRQCINSASVAYADQHLGKLPQLVHEGIFGRPDFAVLECAGLTENGEIIPTLSVGATNTFVECAERVLLEINLSCPIQIRGLHDIFRLGAPPFSATPSICSAGERLGREAIPCPAEKIAGIVISDIPDPEPRFVIPDEISNKIAGHIVDFLKSEIAEKRLPGKFTFQSGFGAVANAVLYGLKDGGFEQLDMYSEILQDGALELILNGNVDKVSASSLTFSTEGRSKLYSNLDRLRGRIVLRPQDITNNGTLISQLGVVAMNTAIECDIYGNVNSTHIMGSAVMNGIGGSGDFARNSAISIFMTPSTAKGGRISSIVPMVSHVDHTEHDVGVIVTEYGLADLRGKCPKDRAEILIAISHPDYREELREYFENAKKSSAGKHTPHDLRTALSWHQRYIDTGTMRR